jgi:hypothetical protein
VKNMLDNVISGARSTSIGVLKSGRDIFGQMNAVLNLGPDKSKNGSFVHLHRSGIKTLFNFIRKAKGYH